MDAVKIETILVPVDFSEYTSQVADYAVSLAKAFGSTVKLLHVIKIPSLPESINWIAAVPNTTEMNLPEELIKISQTNLGDLADRYTDQGVSLESLVVEGVPFVEIVRAVGEHGADMIVMGSHGRTGVSHILMGSVAEKVVRKASCPVLCIKPEGFKFEMP